MRQQSKSKRASCRSSLEIVGASEASRYLDIESMRRDPRAIRGFFFAIASGQL